MTNIPAMSGADIASKCDKNPAFAPDFFISLEFNEIFFHPSVIHPPPTIV